MNQEIYIVSDLHLGAGPKIDNVRNPLEDFFADEDFDTFLERIVKRARARTELIILGDAFDFPQVLPHLGAQWPHSKEGTTEAESLQRINAVIKGHPLFFDALRRFISAGHTVTIMRGNHDLDLIWPEVQNTIRQELVTTNAEGTLDFPSSHACTRGPLYCEHGNQYSAENLFKRPDDPTVRGKDGVRRLERCWGTYFMDIFYNEVEEKFPPIDNADQMARAALLAARSGGVRYTGKQVGRLIKLAFRGGLPIFGWIKAGVMGEDDGENEGSERPTINVTTADELVGNLADRALRDHLSKLLEDDAFRKDFEAEVQDVIDEHKNEALVKDDGASEHAVMGLLTGKDAYKRAAEKILKADTALRCVVFGHTHSPVDGNSPDHALELQGSKKYFNSGSWTRSLDLQASINKNISFEKLNDHGTFKTSLDYVKVVVGADGTLSAELRSAGTAKARS